MLAEENRYAVLLPLVSVSVAGLINMFYLTPKVGRVIKERFLQGLSSLSTHFDLIWKFACHRMLILN